MYFSSSWERWYTADGQFIDKIIEFRLQEDQQAEVVSVDTALALASSLK